MTAADLGRRTAGLVRAGAMAAVVGGALRIVSTFIPYEPNSPGLEALYGVIDLGLMFGLVAVYIASAEAIGMAGLALFLVALAGVASIVGPDAPAFGIDFYRAGALVFVAGLAGLSVQLLRAGLMRMSAALWLATFAAEPCDDGDAAGFRGGRAGDRGRLHARGYRVAAVAHAGAGGRCEGCRRPHLSGQAESAHGASHDPTS